MRSFVYAVCLKNSLYIYIYVYKHDPEIRAVRLNHTYNGFIVTGFVGEDPGQKITFPFTFLFENLKILNNFTKNKHY